MAKLLIRIDDAPSEEIDALCALLAEQDIAHYLTDAGRWRVGTSALWLADAQDYAAARAIVDPWQEDYTQRARAQWQQARDEGQVLGFWQRMKAAPVLVLLAVGAALIIAVLSVGPFFWLADTAPVTLPN